MRKMGERSVQHLLNGSTQIHHRYSAQTTSPPIQQGNREAPTTYREVGDGHARCRL